MNNFFKKIKVGCLNDHFDQLGGGTVHSFKLLEYLKEFYDVDVYLPKAPKTREWMKTYLHLDTEGLKFYQYAPGIGKKYPYMFFNVSHWRAEETEALKKYMLVFFPQFFFPITSDYKFLANSEYTKENIIRRWQRKTNKIHVIYPPIMTSQFKPCSKTNTIVHVSRIAMPRPEADKGHKQMIRAFKEMVDDGLKNWSFYLIGQVQDQNYYNELLTSIGDYPIQIFPGIPFSKLKQLYGEAKIYWHLTGITMPNHPGAQEHFGMVIIEAMASGCVPISLNTGGPREIITNSVDGFLVDDIDELKRQTWELINKKRVLNSMRKMAIERSKCFDEEKTKKDFYSLISKTSKVSIVTICWNNAKYTKECVDRLYKVTPPGFELILIDNDSQDNTWAVLTKLQEKYTKLGHEIKIHKMDKNAGFAGANNFGLTLATKPYICYLNNDTLPQYGWLERMVDVLELKSDAGVVGARLYFPKSESKGWIVQHAGITFDSGEPKHIGRHQEDKFVRQGGIEEVEAVTGACMLVRKRLAKFQTKYTRGYYEDNDLCLRAREKGYKIYVNHEACLIHYEGVSQNIAKRENKEEFNNITLKNKQLFHKCWDAKIKKLPKISKMIDTIGMDTIKNIEIGGGENPLYPDYTQIDLRKLPGVKLQEDARALSLASNFIKNICACYMLQCLPQEEAERALREWYRCLQPGGKLELHVPDLDKATRIFISTQDETILEEIYGKQEHELDYYQSGWTFATLDRLLSKINFVRVTKIRNPKNKPYSLSVEAFKPK